MLEWGEPEKRGSCGSVKSVVLESTGLTRGEEFPESVPLPCSSLVLC